MINFVGSHGTSFKGLMAYLLHDKEADTSERVAWTHTRNLATDDPEKAWKIMVGTAKCQAELKADAGVGNTGRKSNNHVMHYSLSWSREHDPDISRDEMLAAAEASMTYLGVYEGEKLGRDKKAGKMKLGKRTQFADEHQAIIVAHDEPGGHPHVHVVVNRVHAEHGVMLPDNYEKEKLSAWALDYRTAQGKEDLCPKRVVNAAKKAQGIVTSNPRKPRHIYEQEQAIAEADPGSRKKTLLEQLANRQKDLKTKTEAMHRGQAQAVHALEDRHVADERQVRSETAESIKATRAEIKAAHAPVIDALIERQYEEIQTFKEAQSTAAGRVRNTWEAFKTKQWMTEIRTDPIQAMKHSFSLAFDSGMQLRDIEKHHTRELGDLRGARTAEERAIGRDVRSEADTRLEDLRQQFTEQRNDLLLEQRMDQALLKAEWKQLDRDRSAVEIEDRRKSVPQVDSDRSGGDSGGGKKPQPLPETHTPVQDFEPANDNPHDVPIDEIRKQQLDWVDNEWGDDSEPDQGDHDFDRE